jgi:hypothetical protein
MVGQGQSMWLHGMPFLRYKKIVSENKVYQQASKTSTTLEQIPYSIVIIANTFIVKVSDS